MAKLLLFIAFVVFLYLRFAGKRRRPPPNVRSPEGMIPCAHCGIYIPQSEALVDNHAVYCCEAHRLRGASK
ncbi:PP0621 family protein [Rugosibacter aromaticivorans]|uniref:PP0621 family protein n=1 Tax=Rugosibacter aromaticivorans TaxID=1565605 RepID=UPI001215CF6D|nr:MAG: hypothetical protein EPO43_01845 [Rugosibacter sp.]